MMKFMIYSKLAMMALVGVILLIKELGINFKDGLFLAHHISRCQEVCPGL
jgi:hypothetical protein